MRSGFFAILFIGLFFLFLMLPGIGAFTGIGRQSAEDIRWSEQRAKWPFSVDSPRAFNRWFEDNLGWRGRFFGMHERIVHGILGQSPSEGRVRVGREGFLFLGDDFMRVFSRHAGVEALSGQELEESAKSYAALVAVLEKLGIPALLVIAPDKPSIYPDMLPSYVKAPRPALPMEWGKMLPGGAHYLAPALLAARKKWAPRLVYLRNDTHWNALGAYAAYRDVLAAMQDMLGRRLAAIELRGVKDVRYDSIHPDLARFMYLSLPYYTFELEFVPPLCSGCKDSAWPQADSPNRLVQCQDALNDIEVLFVHDSFLGVYRSVYDSTFSRLITMHIRDLENEGENAEALQLLREGRAKPTIAVIMLVERTIAWHAPAIASLARRLDPGPNTPGGR